MLTTKWLLFFLMTFALCSVLSGFISGSMGQELPWNDFLSTYSQIHSAGDFLFSIPALAGGLIGAFWNMFWWNYTFLVGTPWVYVKFIVFLPISIGMAISLTITLIGTLTGRGS